MKVKMLTGLIGTPKAAAGDIVDLPAEVAKKYIKSKRAVAIKASRKRKTTKKKKVDVESR